MEMKSIVNWLLKNLIREISAYLIVKLSRIFLLLSLSINFSQISFTQSGKDVTKEGFNNG